MAAEPSCTIPNPHERDKPLVYVTLANVTPLKSANYLTWERQVEAILDGFDLFKYPDGSYPSPPQTIQSNATSPEEIPNPAFYTWKRQDRLVYGAILPTLTESVASLVTQTTTSAELWAVLKKTFARPTRGHKKQLKDRLRSIVKGTSSITEYMNSIKTVADLLASIGAPMGEEDLTDHVLRGLDEAYQPVIDGVNARDLPIPFDELHEKLLNREITLKMQQKVAGPITALTSQQHSSSGPPVSNWAKSKQFQPNAMSPNNAWRSPSSPRRPERSGQKKQYLGKCQWCRTVGHLMPECPIFRQQNPSVHIPAQSHRIAKQPQVNTASTGAQGGEFLVDSGATHHVTTDLENLAIYHPYTGPDSLFVGDGSGSSHSQHQN